MQLRRADVAGLSRVADHLPARDVIAFRHHELFRMRVSGDITVVMADQGEIAVALKLASGIADDPVRGGTDGRAFGNRDVDPVIAFAACSAAEFGEHPAAHRPNE